MEIKIDEEQIKRFVPKTVQKRMALLNGVVAELSKRNFKRLDENNTEDLQKVISIVSDMHPESNYYKVREYARVAIRLWNKQRSQ